TSSPSKSPLAARCKSPAVDTPASSPSLCPLPRSRDDAPRTRRAPPPPFPVAPPGARTRPSCTVPAGRPDQTRPPSLLLQLEGPPSEPGPPRLLRHPTPVRPRLRRQAPAPPSDHPPTAHTSSPSARQHQTLPRTHLHPSETPPPFSLPACPTGSPHP